MGLVVDLVGARTNSSPSLLCSPNFFFTANREIFLFLIILIMIKIPGCGDKNVGQMQRGENHKRRYYATPLGSSRKQLTAKHVINHCYFACLLPVYMCLFARTSIPPVQSASRYYVKQINTNQVAHFFSYKHFLCKVMCWI